MPGDPFRIDSPSIAPARRAALTAARPFLSWLLRLRTLRDWSKRMDDSVERVFHIKE